MVGKTTNERFSRKAQNSFSEGAGGEGTTTYMDGRSESESFLGDRNSRASIVADENEGERARGGRRSRNNRRT